MCRNIKKLRRPEGDPTDHELHDAALQFVRKISGFRVPSQKNAEVFDLAVDQVAEAARRLFDGLDVRVPSGAAHHTHDHRHDHRHDHDHPHGHDHPHSHDHTHSH